jgi:hypothetical protein
MKTFFVFKEIAECALLIMGGKDNTVLHHVTTFTKGKYQHSKEKSEIDSANFYVVKPVGQHI